MSDLADIPRDNSSDNSTSENSKGEKTRLAILTAAITRFGRDGYRSTSVADIARDANVGGTVAYAYFSNKEALFTAALDEDTAAVINDGLREMLSQSIADTWRESLIFTLLTSIDKHPLARRVLAGLEPAATGRVVDLQALVELRVAVGERLRLDQEAGVVRADIDPMSIGSGAVAIILALLMAITQFGDDAVGKYWTHVLAVFDAALEPPGQATLS